MCPAIPNKKEESIFDKLFAEPEELATHYALRIGEITIAWNSLHSVFFFWFSHLLKIDPDAAKSLWEKGTGDAHQRNMLKSILSLIETADVRESLDWGINVADRISQYRNTLIHTPIIFNIDDWKYNPAVTSSAKHAERLNLIDKKRLGEPLKLDISRLERYLYMLLLYYQNDKDALPRNPVLQAVPEMNKREDDKSHSDS